MWCYVSKQIKGKQIRFFLAQGPPQKVKDLPSSHNDPLNMRFVWEM